MINWNVEKPLIQQEARLHGPLLDARVLMAIRVAEDGGPGREFGVLSVSAPTYAEQLRIAADTVSHRLWSYPGNPLTVTADGDLVISQAWVAWFASIWAPQGAVNDPQGLNKNWTKNFYTAYMEFVEQDRQLLKEGLKATQNGPPKVTFIGARLLPDVPQGAKIEADSQNL